MCPDDSGGNHYQDIWKVKNSYTNKTERISFNIEIIECEGPGCESPSNISKLLDNLEFTIFTLVDRVEFTDSWDEQEPFVTKENYIGRFMLARDVYRETKNFIRINMVEDSYSRLPFA